MTYVPGSGTQSKAPSFFADPESEIVEPSTAEIPATVKSIRCARLPLTRRNTCFVGSFARSNVPPDLRSDDTVFTERLSMRCSENLVICAGFAANVSSAPNRTSRESRTKRTNFMTAQKRVVTTSNFNLTAGCVSRRRFRYRTGSGGSL